MQVRALEFYSGIGGLHLALSRSRLAGSIIKAFDWDQTACQVYEANFGQRLVCKVDISTLTASDLSPLDATLWLLSPSCQPYTVLNPNAKGASDPRAKSFFHLVDDVLPELAITGAQPRYILVENVAGFQASASTHLVSRLRGLGYSVQEFSLTPLQFGIPNSRLRYYLLAKMASLKFTLPDSHTEGDIMEYIPGPGDSSVKLLSPISNLRDNPGQELRKYLDIDLSESDTRTYRIPDRVLTKWGRLFDIVIPSGRQSCCFTRGYTQLVERSGSILQMNENLNTTLVFDGFLQSHAEGDTEAVRQLDKLELRYFTPAELLRLFHFVDARETFSFAWPSTVSLKSKYRLIGNSVNVEIVRQLINYLVEEPGERNS
ncbi:S-adenosyl-L-methionine-dependent methyltransferase [Leucogyrophana mollusca]|uniref:S-adenosyl-L-methionine-dependent methyltransferase n=1 Tax=Leucogyrophana mollusca TaxID=85980 RepID=A0ACB8BK70_9AGAM|nr:S-adenosyl-L-methionine-dependent methyltransferase [Leucogyrophana mollusca]